MTQETRATKNLELEIQRFYDFSTNILVPVFRDITLNNSNYRAKREISLRMVNELYGHSTSKVFNLLFKRISRGGYSDKTKQAYQTSWVPNIDSLIHFADWHDTTEEMTSRSLYLYLVEHQCEQLEWVKEVKAWLPIDLIEQIKDRQKVQDLDDTNFTTLKKSLLEQSSLA